MYAGTHYVFLMQFLHSIPCHFSLSLRDYYSTMLWSFLLSTLFIFRSFLFSTLLQDLCPHFYFFLMLYILCSIMQNVKNLWHNLTANSASMFFPRYLLPFLCSCNSFVLWGNCTGHTPNCSVWGEKNQFFFSPMNLYPSALIILCLLCAHQA